MTQLKDYKHTVAMTDDTTWTGAVPPGHQIIDITFVNSTGNEAIIDCGSVSGGNDIFKNQVIVANDITTVVISKTLSMLERKSVFINDDDAGSDFNGASLTAIMSMRNVII
uniref:Uncharacterized protein n=1 Tax=viral metagenome TaxID=1070528 RepID=A0A6M3JK60_9ZZZZ